jgi:hypothetical protein
MEEINNEIGLNAILYSQHPDEVVTVEAEKS